MHIDRYSFGKITIDDKTYTSDVIVYPDRVDASWWRKQGHYLQEEDLLEIVKEKPEVLVIGTGYAGLMRVPDSIRNYVESKGIVLYVQKTGKAVTFFNEQPPGRKTIGAFHITC